MNPLTKYQVALKRRKQKNQRPRNGNPARTGRKGKRQVDSGSPLAVFGAVLGRRTKERGGSGSTIG